MRSRWVLISFVSHSMAIGAAAIVPLLAAVDLPPVHSPLPAYVHVFQQDIQLPPAPRRPGPAPVAMNLNAAPTEAPPGIGEETARQALATDAPQVEGGPEPFGSTIEGVNIGEIVAPPLPPNAPEAVRISAGVKPPRKIVDVAPVYPPIAVSARVDGIVILEAVIDTRGYVQDVRVLRSIPLLDQAAIGAVRQWRYTPTLLNGVPVSVVMTVTVRFALAR